MKITFIRPTMVKGIRSSDAMHPLAFAVLAGLTPSDVAIEFFDERIEEIPQQIQSDLVAISVQTFTARRAYEIAKSFTGKKIPVVLGGYHPTFMSAEALQHADSVVVGPAEGVWQNVIRDAKAGTLAKIYQQEKPVGLGKISYDRKIFNGKKYSSFVPVEFNRGCKYACEFCSVASFNQNRHASRPVSEVIEEIKCLESKTIAIIDDNIFADEKNAVELFQALIPLKIKWGAQASIDIANHDDVLGLMARSGCVAVSIGFESLNPKNLKKMNKSFNTVKNDYQTAIKKIYGHGIMIQAFFLLGYDYDTADIFDKTVEFALQNKFFLAGFNTLTPQPGTRLYKRYRLEKRLLDENWWLNEKYQYGEVMFRPRNMSAAQLKEGCIKARMQFYKYSQILNRSLTWRTTIGKLKNLGIYFAGNFIARREILRKMELIHRCNS
ncbi:BchE/P-methylase family protein [Olavius sp. associated proteobacterium Delta 1]|nr:BchE/P-methylase family protein [Olavius sp. associated proteobacterium Delta 1]